MKEEAVVDSMVVVVPIIVVVEVVEAVGLIQISIQIPFIPKVTKGAMVILFSHGMQSYATVLQGSVLPDWSPQVLTLPALAQVLHQ